MHATYGTWGIEAPAFSFEEKVRVAAIEQHPFEKAAARAVADLVAQTSRPLYPPGSAEHTAYITRVMARGSFSSGMAAQVVRLDPRWASARCVMQHSVCVGPDDEIDVEMSIDMPQELEAEMVVVRTLEFASPLPVHDHAMESPTLQSQSPLSRLSMLRRQFMSRSRTPKSPSPHAQLLSLPSRPSRSRRLFV